MVATTTFMLARLLLVAAVLKAGLGPSVLKVFTHRITQGAPLGSAIEEYLGGGRW